MCCKKKTMIGRRNVCCAKWRVPSLRGRPKKTWREIVEKDCQAHKLNREDAMDHIRWTIDNHDRYEWLNVSSGTGSPGLPQTKSVEL